MLSVSIVIIVVLAGLIAGTMYGLHALAADLRSVIADMRSVMAIAKQDISDEGQKIRKIVADEWAKR